MWSAIRWLVLRIAAIRWLFKLGGLAFLLPLALLLKTIGLPLLGVLAVVGDPGLLILLFLFGLPIFLVLHRRQHADGADRDGADDRHRGAQDRRCSSCFRSGCCGSSAARLFVLDVQARRRR